MKKNVASQIVGAQLNSKTDGSAVTSGTTTVYVTGDGGTQAVGSVGSGACTHEGNGFWTYAPAQAETNYDHVAFTFVNTSAVNATVQIYTSFPQTGDNYARIGAPAGASVSADVAAIKAETATILSDTNDIQTRIPAALVSGRIDASVGAMAAAVVTAAAIATDAIDADALAADAVAEIQAGIATAANLATVAGYIDTEVAAIKAKTDNLPAAPAAVGDIPTAAAVADAVWDEAIAGHAGVGSTGEALAAAGSAGDPWATALPGAYGAGTAGKIIGDNLNATVSSRASQTSLDTVDDFLDTEIAAILADTNELQTDWANGGRLDLLVDAIKAKTDNLPASPAATSDIPTAAENADKLLGRNLAGGADGTRTVQDALRALRNKTSIAAGTLTVTQEDDATVAWTAAVTTAAGDPLASIDPA